MNAANVIAFLIVFVIIPSLIIGYFIYESSYYKSEIFLKMKKRIEKHINDCNELNAHIESLKGTFVNIKQTDYGHAYVVDNSAYNYKRPELRRYVNNQYVYNCSLVVCRNAQQQPFKYLCKYFNIEVDEKTLTEFENVLNNFSAAENGKQVLKVQRIELLNSIWGEIPWIIRLFGKERVAKKLGLEKVDLKTVYFPTYIFRYISSGGNSSMQVPIVFDINNLNGFITYLGNQIKFRNSIAGQRALMTTYLRERIKKRDNYTCQKCHNSIKKEPNLLLEIDHIKPLSKGGFTSEDNLQTLCWKCNRQKGAKYKEEEKGKSEEKIEPNKKSNYCTNCGNMIGMGEQFCSKCGMNVEE